MAIIGTLAILSQLSTKGFDKGAKGIRGGLQSISKFATSTTGVIAGMGAALGAGAVIGGLVSLTQTAMQAADDISATAGLVGTTVKNLSELHHAATRSDVDIATLDASFIKLNANLAEAASTGKGATADALKQLGLSASELSAMDPADAMKRIADGIAGVENPAMKTRLSMDLLGKSGAQMVGFLSQGSAGIEALQEEARKLGVSLDDVDAQRILLANDSLDKVKAAMSGIGQEIAIQVGPIISDLAERLLATGVTGSTMGQFISTALEWTVKGIGVVLDVLDVLRDGFYLLRAVIATAIQYSLFPLRKLAEGLDWILEKTTGVSSGAGEFFGILNEELDRTAKDAWKTFDENFNARTPSEEISSWFDGVKAKAAAMEAPLRKSTAAIEDMAEAMQKANEDASKLVEKLQAEIDTFGMGSSAAEIYKLRKQGASEATLQQAEKLAEELRVMELFSERNDKLKEDAKSIIESLLTPQEQFAKRQKELQELAVQGLLNKDQVKKAEQKAREEIFGAVDNTPQFAGALEFGSTAARSAILSFKNGGEARKDAATKAAETTALEAKRFNTNLDKIAKRLDEDYELTV